MSEVNLTRIDAALRTEFLRAWEAAFSRSLDARVYDWIFDRHNIVYGAVINGRVAAGYCLYPLDAIVAGKKATALLCNNVFVCPEHQGKQLFVNLGRAALEDAGRQRYGEIAYGIPNAQALPGHRKVGWGVQAPIRFLEKRRERTGLPRGPGWQNPPLTQVQRESIEKCSLASAQGRNFSIIKTAGFVQWRFESKFGVDYWFGLKLGADGLLAYCICKYYEPSQTLHFIDLDGVDDAALAQLVVEAESLPDNFATLNIWECSARSLALQDLGYAASTATDQLILIDPRLMAPIQMTENVNICLADNDVY